MNDMRPRLHVTPRSGWLNDPNGLCRVDGTWHLFHQFSPLGPTWGPPHWAHLSSPDLAHWTEEPIALAPTGSGPDGGGIWSGCTVDDRGTPTAVYTGVEATADGGWTQTVCIATSDRSLQDWTRDPANPVIPGPVDEPAIGFRDPFVFRDGDAWGMLIGTGSDPVGGRIARFRSRDLRSWDFTGYILERSGELREPVWTGRMWECPQLARTPHGDLLVWSVWDDLAKEGDRFPAELHYPVAATGRLGDDGFEVARLERFDYGSDCYAPAFLVEPSRTLAWGWSWESLTEAGRNQQGWAGALTFPREVELRPDGRVRQRPALDLRALRGPGEVRLESSLGANGVRVSPGTSTAEVRLLATAGAPVRLDVLASPDGRERTRIEYDPDRRELSVDRSRSSAWAEAIAGRDSAPLPLQEGEELDLTVLLDVSIVEVFANGRVVLTERVYPTLPDSTDIVLAGPRGAIEMAELTFWPLLA